MKEFCQPRIIDSFLVLLEKADKSPIPHTLEAQTDAFVSMDKEDRTLKAQQRVCAWCNKVMREGTKPATHGMCPKCLEEQTHSLEEQKSHSGSEAPVREILLPGQSQKVRSIKKHIVEFRR